MKYQKLFVAVFLLLIQTVWAQQPTLVFHHTNHDFGAIPEADGVKKHRFVFTNKGKVPLQIFNVEASCGCTTPDWSKQPIAPGKQGFIEAAFNPAGRPGPFDKQLSVFSNGEPQIVLLNIRGNVTGRDQSIAELLPRKLGSLRLKSEHLYIDSATTQKPRTQRFKVYNEGAKPISFGSIADLPKHIQFVFEPVVLQPKQTGFIKIVYNAKLKNDYGYQADRVYVPLQGDTMIKQLKLEIAATIEDFPRKLKPAEAAKAPQLRFEKLMHDFGKIKEGEVMSYEFVFRNKGKQDVVIYKTAASCGCTASDPAKKVLKPGESSFIKVSFNSAGKHPGEQKQSVTVYSNDPANPKQVLNIKATVQGAMY